MDPPSAAAMLAASVAAAEKSPDDPSVLEKARSTAFHSLATLRAALRAAESPQSLAALPSGPSWLDSARVAIEDAIMAKHLQATAATRYWLCQCLAACFRFPSVGHHLYGTLKAFHAVANHKASPPLCRAAVVAGVGALCLEHGARVGSLNGDCVSVCARQLPLRDLSLRRAAMGALASVLRGLGDANGLSESAASDALKAIYGSTKDKAPEVRAAAAEALSELAKSAPGGVHSSPGSGVSTTSSSSSSSSVGSSGSSGGTSGSSGSGRPGGALPLEATLALCVKGLDDGSMAVKMAFAQATAVVLSVTVAGQAAAEASRAVAASRTDKSEDAEDKKAAAGGSRGGGSGSSGSGSSTSGGSGASGGSTSSSGSNAAASFQSAVLKTMRSSSMSMGVAAAAAVAGRSSGSSSSSSSSSSFTLQSAVGHLCALFTRAATRSQRAGTAAAMVAFLQLQIGPEYRSLRVGEPEHAWVTASLLSLLAHPRWGNAETAASSAMVGYMLRAGVGACCSEPQQVALLEELLRAASAGAYGGSNSTSAGGASAAPAMPPTPAASESISPPLAHSTSLPLPPPSSSSSAGGGVLASVSLTAEATAPSHSTLTATAGARTPGGNAISGGGGGGGGGLGVGCNEWQLQVVLSEASHLVSVLGEAVAPLEPTLVDVCWRALDHREYSVRYEAATTLAALLRAMPFLGGPLLHRACLELEDTHAKLVDLAIHPTKLPPSSSSQPDGDPRARAMAAASAKADAEKKKKAMFSLHGRATVIAVALQSVNGLAPNLPLARGRLVTAAEALVARRDDVSLQTRDTMGVLCTCVRAGWALTTALLCVGVEPTTRHLPQLLLHWRAAVGNQPPNPPPTTTTTTSSSRTGGHHHHADAHLQGRSSAFEPTHELVCLDAALNCILGFVRLYPEVFFHKPVALGHVTAILRQAADLVKPGSGRLAVDPSVAASKQGRFRLRLISTVLMEAYLWLPPGSYPDMSELLCHMACDIFRSLASSTPPSSASSSDRSSSCSDPGGSSSGDAPESSLLETLVNPEDNVLGMMSSYYCASNQGSLDASGGLDACIALQAHLTGVPLEPIERELAVYSPSWSPLSSSTSSYGDHDVSSGGDGADSVGYGSDGYSSNTHAAAGAGPGGGGSGSERPPTPLHGATWRRPPSSSARLENRLLDASIQMCAATFATQDDHYQAAAIESMAELLIDRSFANASAFSSVLISDDDKKRREKRQRIVHTNVATALLAILKSIRPYAESEYNVDVPWVRSMHDALLMLLKSPVDAVRRAAGEGLALLATNMGTVYQAQLLQQLVDFIRGSDGSGYGGGSEGDITTGGGSGSGGHKTGLGRKSSSSGSGSSGGNLSGEGASEAELLSTGAVFALACLKRSAPAVEAGGFWRELESLLSVGGASQQPLTPQPLRTWALHALCIVARTLDLGLAQQARVRSMLHGMTSLLEAHFLGAWSSHPSASLGCVLEPAMMVALLQLTTAMVPMVQALAPNQALVARFEAVCFGVVDIVPWALLPSGGASGGGGSSGNSTLSNPDPRIVLEALHTAELLAAFRPAAAAASSSSSSSTRGAIAASADGVPVFNYSGAALGLCKVALDKPLMTSPHVLAAALRCLQGLMRGNPSLVQDDEDLLPSLLAAYDALLGAATCARAHIWRGLSVARRLEAHFESRHHLLPSARRVVALACAIDCDRPHLPRRPVHWLLMARTIVTGQAGAAETGGLAVGAEGAGDGRGAAGEGGSSSRTDDSANPTGARDDSDDDDEGGGGGASNGVGGGGGALIGYMGVAVQTRQVAAAAAITGTTANYGPGCPPRWQVKHAAVQLASQALSIAAQHARLETDSGDNKKITNVVTASCHMDVAMARASVASALAAYGNPSTSANTSSFNAFSAASSSSSTQDGGGDNDFGTFAPFDAFGGGESSDAFPQSPSDGKKGGLASAGNTAAFSPSSTPAAASSLAAPTASSVVRFDDVAAYSALPDYCALHLEALIGTACAAATHTLGDTELGVSSLQAGGLQLLAATVQLFKGCPDPDAVIDSDNSAYKNSGKDGSLAPPVLGQFTSQVASAFRPSLVALHRPRLVHTGANALCVATAYGLVTDPGRLKRLLHVLLPPGYYQGGSGKGVALSKICNNGKDGSGTVHSTSQQPLGPLRLSSKEQTNQSGASTSNQLYEHVSRLLALADLLVLAAAPLPTTAPEGGNSTAKEVATALPSAVAGAVKTTLLDDEHVVASLVAAWGALLSDALRLKQGDGHNQEGEGERERSAWWPSSSSSENAGPDQGSSSAATTHEGCNRSRTGSSSSVGGRGASSCGPGLLFGAPSDVTPAIKRLLVQRWPAVAAALACVGAHFSAPEPTINNTTTSSSTALSKTRAGAAVGARGTSKAPPVSLGAILPLCAGACLAALLEPSTSSSPCSEEANAASETASAAADSSSLSSSNSSGVSGSGLELCLLVVHTLWCDSNASAHLHAHAVTAASAAASSSYDEDHSTSEASGTGPGEGTSWPPPAVEVVPPLLRALTLKTLSPTTPYPVKLRGLALLHGLLLASSSSSSAHNGSGNSTWLRDAIPVEPEASLAINEEVIEEEGKTSDTITAAQPFPGGAPGEGQSVAAVVVDEVDWGDDDEWGAAQGAAPDTPDTPDTADTASSSSPQPHGCSSDDLSSPPERLWWESAWEQGWRQWAAGSDVINFTESSTNGATDSNTAPASEVQAIAEGDDSPTLEDAPSPSASTTLKNSEAAAAASLNDNEEDDDDDDEFGAFGTADGGSGDVSSSSANETPAAPTAIDGRHATEWGTENDFDDNNESDDKNGENASSSGGGNNGEQSDNGEDSPWGLLLATVAMPVSQLTPYSIAVDNLMSNRNSKDEPTNSGDFDSPGSDEVKTEPEDFQTTGSSGRSSSSSSGGGAISRLLPSALANVPLACAACPPSRRSRDLPSILALLLRALLSTALAPSTATDSAYFSVDSDDSSQSVSALVAVRSAGGPAFAAVAGMVAAQLPTATAQSLLATSALYAARAAAIVASVMGDYSATSSFAPPKTSSEKAMRARRVRELETCHALCLDVWAASQHASPVFCPDAFQTVAMLLGRRNSGSNFGGSSGNNNNNTISPVAHASLRKALAASLVRALQDTLQAEKAAATTGSTSTPSMIAARKRKAQQFCAALSPLALALVYESSSSSSSSNSSQGNEGEDAVSIELVKGLLLHAQAADSLAGPGATTALVGLLLPLCAALLSGPSSSNMGTALKSVLTRAVLHLAQSCPDAFRAQVPALSAAHQDALKQAMASALRTDNGSNQQANSVKASTAPPALKKIDMSQYSKK